MGTFWNRTMSPVKHAEKLGPGDVRFWAVLLATVGVPGAGIGAYHNFEVAPMEQRMERIDKFQDQMATMREDIASLKAQASAHSDTLKDIRADQRSLLRALNVHPSPSP